MLSFLTSHRSSIEWRADEMDQGNHGVLISRDHDFPIMRTRRIRALIGKLLTERDHPMSFREILDWCNQNTKHGMTAQGLGNVLSKNPEFIECDRVMVKGTTSGRYSQSVWIYKQMEQG